MNRHKAILVDLEGTLTNCSHRIHHLEAKNYEAWEAGFPEDSLNVPFLATLRKHAGKALIICSAKSKEQEGDARRWLQKYDVYNWFTAFYFRNPTDMRSSVAVKRDLVKKILKKYDVVEAYDDRPEMCKLYSQEFGIPSCLVGTTTSVREEIKPLKILTPPQRLRHSAEVQESRNEEYADSYKTFGPLLKACFPDGIHIDEVEDMNRLGCLIMALSKVHRYTGAFMSGGHADSLVDLPNYASMLAELDELKENK